MGKHKATSLEYEKCRDDWEEPESIFQPETPLMSTKALTPSEVNLELDLETKIISLKQNF